MAEKKSFVMYNDWESILGVLSREEKGRLLEAIYAYVNRGELEECEGALKAVLLMITQQLDRDKEKWKSVSERNRNVARSRWSKRNNSESEGKQTDTKNTRSTKSTRSTKNADTDTVTVNDTVTDIVTDTETVNDTAIDTESESVTVTEKSAPRSPGASAGALSPAHANDNSGLSLNTAGEQRHSCGSYGCVMLSENEREMLCRRYDSGLVEHYIERLDTYIKTKQPGYRPDSHGAVIAKWIREDSERGRLPVIRAKQPEEPVHAAATDSFIEDYYAYAGSYDPETVLNEF